MNAAGTSQVPAAPPLLRQDAELNGLLPNILRQPAGALPPATMVCPDFS